MAQKIDEQKIGDRMEERFQYVECRIPVFADLKPKEREFEVKKWLGEVCKKIFSVGFSLFEKG